MFQSVVCLNSIIISLLLMCKIYMGNILAVTGSTVSAREPSLQLPNYKKIKTINNKNYFA